MLSVWVKRDPRKDGHEKKDGHVSNWTVDKTKLDGLPKEDGPEIKIGCSKWRKLSGSSTLTLDCLY